MDRVPSPVSVSIDGEESARLRSALFARGGERALLLSSALFSVVGILTAALQVHLRGWRDPLVFGPVSFYVAYLAFMFWRANVSCVVRSEAATMVTFDDLGMLIQRDGVAPAMRIPFARIRSVRLMPEVIAVYGIWRPYVTIPIRALPDGGSELLRFFSDRIVSKGLPQNSSHGVTTIYNSVSPVLARR